MVSRVISPVTEDGPRGSSPPDTDHQHVPLLLSYLSPDMCQTLESLAKMSIHMCSSSVSKMFASVQVETGWVHPGVVTRNRRFTFTFL